MNEASFRLEIQKLMRGMGFWDYHPEDHAPVATEEQIWQIVDGFKVKSEWRQRAFDGVKKILIPEEYTPHTHAARPDIYNLHPLERTVIIECKLMAPRKNVEPSLHPADISEGQRNWLDAWKFQGGGMAFLAVGSQEETPRRAFLIPWDVYVSVEKSLAEHAVEFRLPASLWVKEYELLWVKGSPGQPWRLHEDHPLLPLSTPETSPSQVDWKKAVSLRFVKKEEPTDVTSRPDERGS